MIIKRTVPSGILEVIQGNASSDVQKRRLKRFVSYAMGKYIVEGISFDNPIEISSEHFRNQLGTHYLQDLKFLRSLNVITSDDSYFYFNDHRKGKCKAYSFNPKYIYTDPKIIEYNERQKKKFDNEYVIKQTINILSKLRLTIDSRKLRKYVFDFVSTDYILSKCIIGENIPDDHYHLKGSDIPRSKSDLLDIAKRNSKELILFKNKCYISNLDYFIAKKKFETRTAYLDQLVKLKDIRKRVNIICSRNLTNIRLTNNLTILKSEFLKLVNLDGEHLVNIDLKNSQFRLLALIIEQSFQYQIYLHEKHMNNHNITDKNRAANTYKKLIRENKVINKYKETISTINVTHFLDKWSSNINEKPLLPRDLADFIKLTKNGTFYEYFAKLLSADVNKHVTRNEAKGIMFLVAFSAHRYNPEPKKLLRKHFPNLVLFMDEFKKTMIKYYEAEGMEKKQATKKGNAELAVMLQTVESKIFIDGILTKLLKQGFRVLTKHDSILCKKSDRDAVEAIVRNELDQVFGPGCYQLGFESYG